MLAKISPAKIFSAKMRSLSLSLAAAALALLTHGAQAAEPRRALGASASPAPLLRSAHLLGRLDPGAMLHAEFVLPPRNQAALETLLRRQYTPGDPLYRHFLTPDQFTAQFGPTPQDYAAVAAYARTQGLTVTGTTPGRTLLTVSGSTPKIEAAFGVRMNQYRLPSGRVAFASSAAPTLPRSVAARLSGVIGLNNLAVMHPQLRAHAPAPITGSGGIGSGPLGGLSPNDIKYAYGLDTITTLYGQAGTTTGATGTAATPLDGAGQNIGLFELDGFIAGDVAQYVSQFALPTLLTGAAAPVTTRLVGPYKGVPLTPSGKTEVTLDIDLILALAPNSTGVYVYEADPKLTSPVDVFTAMATDKNSSGLPLLQIISCSWGIDEAEESLDLLNAENAVFQQMAAQGQSVFCAAGDSGAYDAFAINTTGTTATTTGLTAPAVDNPASQPYVTGVGGTKLAFVKPGVNPTTNAVTPGLYTSESVWSSGSPAVNPEGGGGGISSIWSKPSYQTSGASPNRRDVPDVSLNSDPNTGYSIFVGSTATAGGTAEVVGGTSAAAPLWAAYTALINQRRAANGLGSIGFLNPVIYPLLTTTAYPTLFHDIVDGNNLFYQAGPGYDDASGLGSFNGAPLLAALSFNANQGTGTATISGTVTDTAAPPAPITGATVSASTVSTSGAGTTVATTTTDASGTYTLTVPSGVALRITVSVPAPVAPATAIFTGATTTLTALTNASAVSLPFALAPAHLYAGGLQMISAPYDYSGLSDFAAAFGLSAAQAATTTRLVKYVPGSSSYVFYPTAPADTFRLGQGYWTRLAAAGGYLHLPGTPASATQPFSLPLQAGWNQIGDPFLLAAPLSTITVSASGLSAAPLTSAPTVVQAKLYGYDPAANAYIALNPATDSLSPYAGYWIYAFQPCTLTVPVPAGTVTPPGIPGVPGG